MIAFRVTGRRPCSAASRYMPHTVGDVLAGHRRVVPLAGEAAELGRRAQAAGNDVLVRAVAEGQHSFIVGAGRVPEVDEAIAEIGSWLRTALGLVAREGRESA